jgi:hypothetical protein
LEQFADDWAKPFLEDGCSAACKPRTWQGIDFPFTEEFLRLAATVKKGSGAAPAASPKGAKAGSAGPAGSAAPAGGKAAGKAGDASAALNDSYPVVVTVVASEVDPGAYEKPLRTTVTLSSSGSVQSLVNYNYPVSQAFVWKPGVPASVSVEIQLPSVSLNVNYDAPEGFSNFISDLAAGGFTLTPRDFPEHEQTLAAMGITRLDVIMKADGALPAAHALKLSRTPIPDTIVKEAVIPETPEHLAMPRKAAHWASGSKGPREARGAGKGKASVKPGGSRASAR